LLPEEQREESDSLYQTRKSTRLNQSRFYKSLKVKNPHGFFTFFISPSYWQIPQFVLLLDQTENKSMSFIKFLFSQTFLKQIGIILGVFILILVTTFIGLNLYTNHGESYPVPDFSGLTEDQLKEMIEQIEYRYEIIDSVHIPELLPGVVVEQNPKAGAKVKKNRTIFFTINALTSEQVKVPNLVDYSLRNAKVILETYGLNTGNLIYIPSEFTNLVLGQHFEGKPIEPGTSVDKGSRIDLLIGEGLSQEKTNIPDLIGLTMEEAEQFSQSVSLNIGARILDSTVVSAADSLLAFIWKQRPDPNDGRRLRLGESIDIWVTLDSLKIISDSLLLNNSQFPADSLIQSINE
jgi:beta-lactam-binding protein with PASTA domain